MKTCLILLLVFFTLSINPTLAVDNDLSLWSSQWVSLPITSRIGTLFEVSTRTKDHITEWDQIYIRPAISYKLTNSLSVFQGYSWDPNFYPYVYENRVWQQVLHRKPFKNFTLENRARLEERFIKGVNGTAVRARYRLGAWVPLNKKKDWLFVLWDEFWVNLNSRPDGPQGGYDRNWLFAGINKKLSENVTLEGGYMFQEINKVAPTHDILNHVIVLNMYFTLPQLLKDK